MAVFDVGRKVGITLLLAGAVFVAGCAGPTATTIPASATPAQTSKGIDANAFMRSITPASVLPNSVPIPPLQGLGAARSEMSLRKPQSAIAPLGFTQISGAASQVAAAPDGSAWVLGNSGPANGDQAIYHLVNGTFVNVPGAARRIAVGPDNTPWVLNAAGGIYHLVNGVFTGIAGGASELSLGSDGSLYVISNGPPGPYGSAVYRYVNGAWTQLQGAGITVAASIDPNTYPSLNITPGGFYLTNAGGGIFYYNPGVGFEQLPGGAISLAPTANGGLFALGDPGALQHGIYYNDFTTGQWTQMPGAAVALSANSASVYAIGATGGIYVSAITPVLVSAFPVTPSTLDFTGTGGTQIVTASEAGYTGTFTAASSNAGIASVSGSGKQFTVLAVAGGTATITIADKNGNMAYVTVYVTTTSFFGS